MNLIDFQISEMQKILLLICESRDKDRQGRIPSIKAQPVNGKASFRPWDSRKGAAGQEKARKTQKEVYIVLLVGKVLLNCKHLFSKA